MIHSLRYFILLCCAVALLCLSSCQDDVYIEPEEPTVAPETELLDAYKDKLRTQPYPKSNNELYLNPPPLIVPESMMTGQRLLFELSSNAGFNEAETQQSEAQLWCMFTPHRELEAGIWYWRFRQAAQDGTPQGEWSETYSFEVKEETPVFVTPAFSEFYNNAPRHYPRLYCHFDSYAEEARRNVSSHREYKSLIYRARISLDYDYGMGDLHLQASQLQTHLKRLYEAYYLTRQYIYEERMHQLLKRLIATPPSDAILFESNFGTTDIAHCYALIYDQMYNRLSTDERTAIEELLLRVLRKNFRSHCRTQENHIFDNHFWQHNMRITFQCAFLLYDNPIYKDEILPMLEYYYELWTARAPASGFNRDGVWHNGTGYMVTNLYTLHYLPMLFSYVARKDFLQHPWYLNAGRALVYSCPPDSKTNGFGDGSEKEGEPVRQRAAFADFFARELNDPYAGWYVEKCADLVYTDFEFRFYRMCMSCSYDTVLPVDASKMVWYQDAGEVVMHSHLENRDKDVNLAFRSSTFGSGSHTLSNQNAFNLLYKGKDVYRSSGYYLNFDDAHNLMSYRHTRAHNTILVNGIGQPYSTKGYGNVMRAIEGAHITYCLGDASKAYSGISDDPMWIKSFAAAGIEQIPANGFGATPLTKYRRHVLMLHPEGTVLIYDELEAEQPVDYDWLLHSPSRMTIDPELLMSSHFNKEAGFTAVTRLFCNDHITLSQTDQFVVPPDPAKMKEGVEYPNQWHLTARIVGKSKTRILTVIQVNPEGVSPKVIQQDGNLLFFNSWTIEAELDASQPASLSVTHAVNPVIFSYGNDNPTINGEPIRREYRGSSLLYDEINGQYHVTEQVDRLPASTRTGY